MNLKYYLRGLGIGIAMTTVIIGLGVERPVETLSDEEIKARAAQLGMIETGGFLSELEEEPEATEGPIPTKVPEDEETSQEAEAFEATAEPEVAEKPEATLTPEKSADAEATAEPVVDKKPADAKATAEPVADKKPGDAKATAEPIADKKQEEIKTPAKNKAGTGVMIEVKPGESSYTICQKLEEKGLIASASAFDSYLYENEYDEKIQAGTFEIPKDATPEEIAKIITNSE